MTSKKWYAYQQQKKLVDDHMIRFVNDHEMISFKE